MAEDKIEFKGEEPYLAGKKAAVDETVRYDRQKRIWGEEGQKKISQARITIIGSDQCAKYTALPLVALGMGEVRTVGTGDGSEEMLMDVPLGKQEKVYGYEKVLHLLNENVKTLGLPLDLETRLAQEILVGSQILIDTTNDPRSKALALEYAQKNNLPVLTAGVTQSNAKLMLWKPGDKIEPAHLMPNYQGEEQGSLVSLLWGGIIAEEVKKIVLGDKNILQGDLYFKQGSREKFSFRKPDEPIL